MNDIIHLYVSQRLACSKQVAYTRHGADTKFTEDPAKVSCRNCARRASGLTDVQRQEIWDNANERSDVFWRSPWEKAAKQTSKIAQPESSSAA